MKSLSAKLSVLVFCAVALFACSENTSNTNTGPTTNINTTNSTPAAADNTASNSEKAAYPQAVADEFLRSCQAAGSDAKYCECVFEKVRERYTFEEFSVIDSELNEGTPPEEFIEFTGKARAECTK